MSLYILSNEYVFPPVHNAGENGLIAVGGDLSPGRLLAAYRAGIFPWYDDKDDHVILWWSPDPRFVLFPAELKIHKSVKAMLQRDEMQFSMNTAFNEVIRQCKIIKRPGQQSTWITGGMETAYLKMHELGFAHSAEVWQNGVLTGGLYGIRIGQVFFGESMFSKISNASRFAFIRYVQYLQQQGVRLIDCQVHTAYLESFGARMIKRKKFINLLNQLI